MGFSAMGSHIQDKKTLPELYHRLLFVVLIKKIIVEFKKNSISKPKKTMPSNIIYQNYTEADSYFTIQESNYQNS